MIAWALGTPREVMVEQLTHFAAAHDLTAAANDFGVLCGVVNAFEVPAPANADRLPV
jgi:hypothetical protein